MLAEMAINLELSRLVTYKSAQDVDNKVRIFFHLKKKIIALSSYVSLIGWGSEVSCE